MEVNMFTMPTVRPADDDAQRVRRYSTRQEAIEREVVEPLGDYADGHDVEAIAAAVLGDYRQGYACTVDAPTFWGIVERNAMPGA